MHRPPILVLGHLLQPNFLNICISRRVHFKNSILGLIVLEHHVHWVAHPSKIFYLISSASFSSKIRALYTASLLRAWKAKYMAFWRWCPLGLISTISTLAHSLFVSPSTCKVHQGAIFVSLVGDLGFKITMSVVGSSSFPVGNFKIKITSVCPFMVLIGLYSNIKLPKLNIPFQHASKSFRLIEDFF